MSYRQDVAEVRRLTKAIDKGEADVESWKWARAERLAEMVEVGHSRRELSRDTGLSPNTVSRSVAIWERWGVSAATHRPTYVEAFNEVTGDPRAFGTGGAKTSQQQEDEVRRIAKVNPKAVHKVAKEIEAAEAHEPSARRAKAPTSETRNIAALGHLADAREAIHKAVEGADFAEMSPHQQANVEVLFRAMEADFAVARESLTGGISDEAIAAFAGEGM
jgi:hypothetical protein